MKLITYILLILIIILNFLFARPSLADAPKITKSTDYIEVTQSLDILQNQLSSVKSGQPLSESFTVEDIQKKIDELSFQKYALEKFSRGASQFGKKMGRRQEYSRLQLANKKGTVHQRRNSRELIMFNKQIKFNDPGR